MPGTGRPAPIVRALDAALGGVRGTMAAVDRHRSPDPTNAQGGDLGHHASPALLVRHTVNYLLAADAAGDVPIAGPLVDVGSGVGVFSVWLARRLTRQLHIVDHDPDVLAVARRAFDGLTGHADLSTAPSGAVVTAMEVLEHLRYRDQERFVRALMGKVLPGGVLICSTPDERRYVGGWSGYAPHTGTLDPASLRTLLHNATGLPVQVWRIDGPGFRLRRLQRFSEPVANRVWGAAQARVPALTHQLSGALGRRRRTASDVFDPAPPPDAFAVTTDGDMTGQGTGMLAVVSRPPR